MRFKFSFEWPNLGKVFAVRSRKNKQNDPATSHDNGDSVPALHSQALPSDSATVYADSARMEQRIQLFTPGVSDKAQLVLAGAQSIAGPIPLVGGPLQAAINGMLAILQAIDRHGQNKATIASLRRRLQRLSRYLCNAPSARDGSEQSRRDELISLLQETSDRLTELDNGGLVYQSVTQALAGFSTELDHYLIEYSFAAQMDIRDRGIRIEARLEQFQGLAAMGLSGSVRSLSVTLVDATGHHYGIPVEFCTSLEQFKDMLKVLFQSNTEIACIQRGYLEQGQYDLCIDQGTQITELTSNGWSSIEAGTKVVMRVIVRDYVWPTFRVKCNGCGYSNLSLESADIRLRDCWTISCRECQRQYQVSNPSLTRTMNGKKATNRAMMHLIRNIHVQEVFQQRSHHLSNWPRIHCPYEHIPADRSLMNHIQLITDPQTKISISTMHSLCNWIKIICSCWKQVSECTSIMPCSPCEPEVPYVMHCVAPLHGKCAQSTLCIVC